MVIEVTDWEELGGLINTSDRVVVDFAAPAWCIPCQRLAPHYEAASNALPEITFVHVDVDKATELAAFLGIMSVPTVQKFADGKFVGDLVARTGPKIVEELQSL